MIADIFAVFGFLPVNAITYVFLTMWYSTSLE